MATPRFSILIPTRDRPDTFRHTLRTVAEQHGGDYEIVVADNASGPTTRQIVAELGLPHVRYLRSDELLPMATNWERGLEQCQGEYVTVLGDDDGFLPTTLGVARGLIQATQSPVYFWANHTYWWPGTIVYWCDNLLFVTFGNEIRTGESRPLLEQFYRGEVNFSQIPMIYSAFIHRSIIAEARKRYGSFFGPPGNSPDISSGILALHLSKNVVYSTRPLSIRGNSGKSNGTAHWARSLGAKLRAEYVKEERMGLEQIIHPSLIPSPNLQIAVASAKLKCRDAYFPDDAALGVDLQAVVREIVANLNYEPEAYEENLADARALAAKLGAQIDPAAIPALQARPRAHVWGPTTSGVGINGNIAGIYDIYAAAKLVESMMPPLGKLAPQDSPPAAR